MITTRMNWRGGEAITRLEIASEAGVNEGLQLLLRKAQSNAPFETGDLRRSGHVRGDAVVFDIVYAVIHHERLDFEHKIGGPKYLERAMIECARLVLNILADRARKAI